MLRGRSYALPEDMTDLVPDVLRHRVMLSYEALSEGLTPDALVDKIMAKIPPRPSRSNMKSWWRRARSAATDARASPQCRSCARVRVEHVLRRLEWTVIRRLDGLLQGDYRTLMRGAGLDLADLREYQHHDDVRHIDWNVTARLQMPHVRVFTEDREMAAWFLLDLSPSVDFGSGELRKRKISAGFVGVLARLLTRHGNRVGAMLYGTGVDTVIPHAQRPAPRAAPAARMQRAPAPRATGHDPAARPAQVGRGPDPAPLDGVRGVRFHQRARLGAPLAHLAQRHEVVAVRLFDPLELDLPDLGLVTLRDAETGEQLWSTRTTRAFASASPASPRNARPSCAKRWPRSASTRSNCPPTTTWWRPSCASPTCASAAAAASAARAAELTSRAA